MVKRLLGTGTTDSNGVATITYVGKSRGLLQVQAESGSLVSETFALYDCLKYDDGTNTNIWNTNNATLTRSAEGNNLSESTAGTDGNCSTKIDHSVAVEFDVQLVSTNYSKIFAQLGQSANAMTRCHITLPSTYQNGNWHSVKITFENGTGKLYVDNGSATNLTVTNYDSSGELYFRLVTGNEITEINFKNWKCYPI